MNFRLFGNTGLKVSEIGLGCSNIGGGVFGPDGRDSLRLLDRAFELGINFFDTADSYGYGRSEELIGTAHRNRRDQVIIATKTGMLPSSLGRIGRTFLPVLRPVSGFIKPWKRNLKSVSKPRQDFSSSHITRTIEGSLRRLRTDYLDLLQLHSPPTTLIGQEEIFDALIGLRQQGKIRFYGVSAKTIQDALVWLDCPNLSSIQIPFNLLEHEGTREILSQAETKGIAVISRVPFARGLLSPKRAVRTGTGLSSKQHDMAKKRAKRLDFLIKEGQRSIAQASIQFVLSHRQISVVIPGTGVIQHLEENVRALQAPPLSEEELQRIPLSC